MKIAQWFLGILVLAVFPLLAFPFQAPRQEVYKIQGVEVVADNKPQQQAAVRLHVPAHGKFYYGFDMSGREMIRVVEPEEFLLGTKFWGLVVPDEHGQYDFRLEVFCPEAEGGPEAVGQLHGKEVWAFGSRNLRGDHYEWERLVILREREDGSCVAARGTFRLTEEGRVRLGLPGEPREGFSASNLRFFAAEVRPGNFSLLDGEKVWAMAARRQKRTGIEWDVLVFPAAD